MLVPVHADMSQRAEAEQQAPAHLKGPRIRRSRRTTRDSRVPRGQASADTGRGTKRHAAQCDEAADAPQPKRQRGEPREPDCQQASEDAPLLRISAAPAPVVTGASDAAGDPSANLRVCSWCSPYAHLQCCRPGGRPCPEKLGTWPQPSTGVHES